MFSVLQTVQKAEGFYLGSAFRSDCPPVLSYATPITFWDAACFSLSHDVFHLVSI